MHCIELVQILIDRGARLGDALLSAVDDYATVKFLLSRGAKVGSGISNAAGSGNAEVVQLLISHATDAEMDGNRDALNWAAASGRVDAAKVLIKHGFDVNASTKDCYVGETPLLAACEETKVTPQRMAVAKLLIRSGADVNTRNQDGKTAAELLVQFDHDGLYRQDVELQQLLRVTNTR
jgi:ankyrin repeat protein